MLNENLRPEEHAQCIASSSTNTFPPHGFKQLTSRRPQNESKSPRAANTSDGQLDVHDVGRGDGAIVGCDTGHADGRLVGEADGRSEGAKDESPEGAKDGNEVGAAVGVGTHV